MLNDLDGMTQSPSLTMNDIPKLSAVEWYRMISEIPEGLHASGLCDEHITIFLDVFGQVMEANSQEVELAARAYGYWLWDHGYTDFMKATKEAIRVRDAAIGLVAVSLLEVEG